MKEETDNIEVFELVTEGLENIDAYQQTKDERLLKETEALLSKAAEMDREYFKPKYLQAMVSYLNGNKSAAEHFEALKKHAPNNYVAGELSYNQAAALFSAGQYSRAIGLFEVTISSWEDTEIKLLASAGAALAYATRLAENQSEKPGHDRLMFEYHYRHVSSKLPRAFPPNLIRRILRQKPIDKLIANKVREIIEQARVIAKSGSTSNPDMPEGQKALG